VVESCSAKSEKAISDLARRSSHRSRSKEQVIQEHRILTYRSLVE
jgi:hypothetical protein